MVARVHWPRERGRQRPNCSTPCTGPKVSALPVRRTLCASPTAPQTLMGEQGKDLLAARKAYIFLWLPHAAVDHVYMSVSCTLLCVCTYNQHTRRTHDSQCGEDEGEFQSGILMSQVQLLTAHIIVSYNRSYRSTWLAIQY